MAAALLDAGSHDMAAGIKDYQHQHLAFDTPGDCLCRVESAPFLLLPELLADGLLPVWRWLRPGRLCPGLGGGLGFCFGL